MSLQTTKDAKRSGALAPEAVWKCGAAGSGAPRKGDYRLPGAAEETDDVCGQTASGAWAGTAHHPRSSSSRTLMAKPGTDPPAQSVAGSADSGRRRMPENRAVMTDTVCANGRDGRTPAARNTSGGIHPGRGVEE